MKTVKLITCSDAAQAHIIQGALENEGISSLLHNENMSTLLRGYILREIIIGSMSAMPVEESLKSRLQNFIRLKYDP